MDCTIYLLSQNSIFPWVAMTYGLCKRSWAIKDVLWKKELRFHNFKLLHPKNQQRFDYLRGCIYKVSSTTIDGIAQYLYTTYYYKSGNCARVLYSDLSDPDISVMIAVQHDSLWGSHPLAKLEAILRCLMTKRLGDNIDTQSHPLSTCSSSGQKVSHEQWRRAAKYWTTGRAENKGCPPFGALTLDELLWFQK